MLQEEGRSIETFVARQPIFDRRMRVCGYELLYRGDMARETPEFDGDKATSEVILNSFYNSDIEKIVGEKRAFINFTHNLLKREIPQMLSRDKIIVEVLESVIIDNDVIRACKNLKEEGYILALDDFIFENLQFFNPILPYIDIIKVDFIQTKFCTVKRSIMKSLAKKNKKFLAEKVETQEEYREAVKLGFEFFQGYFFEKPYVVIGKDLEPYKVSFMQMIAEVNDTQDFEKMAQIVSQDLALSYKLMRLINSPFYGLGNTVRSARQALVMLGLEEIKKWVTLLMLKDAGKDKPDEVMRISLIRAKFAEKLGEDFKIRGRESELFLMGLFSTLDAVFDKPQEEIANLLPLEGDILEAYKLESDSIFGKMLKVIKDYKKGAWEDSDEILEELDLAHQKINRKLFESIIWADNVMDNIG